MHRTAFTLPASLPHRSSSRGRALSPAAKGRRSHRAGLAPLELVLALPLMLFVMALVVNFGTAAAWKVRAQAATRYAGWRTIAGRTGQLDPNPAAVPSSASLTGSGGTALNNPDTVWNGSAELTTPVVRGPAIADPLTGQVITVVRELEATEGMHSGQADLTLHLPLLKGILPDNGRYRFDLSQSLLDRRWEYHDLGYGDNRSRRAKVWYQLDPQNLPALQQGYALLLQAHALLVANPSAADLDPLDRDDEFIQYTGQAPDFHPRVRGCEMDLNLVRISLIDGNGGLIDQVDRLPGRMARAFIGLYESEIARLEALDPQPPGTDGLIEALQEKVDQLRQFLGSLPRENR